MYSRMRLTANGKRKADDAALDLELQWEGAELEPPVAGAGGKRRRKTARSPEDALLSLRSSVEKTFLSMEKTRHELSVRCQTSYCHYL